MTSGERTRPRGPGTGPTNVFGVDNLGLIKGIIGGAFGLVTGVIACAPITGMVAGAFIAQEWGKEY